MNNYVQGCRNIKKDSVLKHERSNEHQKAVAVKKAADNPSETRIVVSVLNMEKDLLERMEKLFNTAYFIAKKELSFTLFSETLGLLTKVSCSTGNTYRNDKACQQFLCQIDGVMFDDLVNFLNDVDFFSIMVDERQIDLFRK